MRALHALVLLGLAAPACYDHPAFTCKVDEQCRSGSVTGTCESIGLCSFPDPTCASGRRYADDSGDLADVCATDDAGPACGAVDGGAAADAAKPDAHHIDAH